jgi:hypothetical protein
MNSLLPNMRLIGLNSTHEGQDFLELTQKIDATLEQLGHDLAEEAVYIFYYPKGESCVARSTIGPLKELTLPFKSWDWVSAPVERATLKATTWTEAEAELETLKKNFAKARGSILRLVRREEKGRLSLIIEGIIHE